MRVVHDVRIVGIADGWLRCVQVLAWSTWYAAVGICSWAFRLDMVGMPVLFVLGMVVIFS